MKQTATMIHGQNAQSSRTVRMVPHNFKIPKIPKKRESPRRVLPEISLAVLDQDAQEATPHQMEKVYQDPSLVTTSSTMKRESLEIWHDATSVECWDLDTTIAPEPNQQLPQRQGEEVTKSPLLSLEQEELMDEQVPKDDQLPTVDQIWKIRRKWQEWGELDNNRKKTNPQEATSTTGPTQAATTLGKSFRKIQTRSTTAQEAELDPRLRRTPSEMQRNKIPYRVNAQGATLEDAKMWGMELQRKRGTVEKMDDSTDQGTNTSTGDSQNQRGKCGEGRKKRAPVRDVWTTRDTTGQDGADGVSSKRTPLRQQRTASTAHRKISPRTSIARPAGDQPTRLSLSVGCAEAPSTEIPSTTSSTNSQTGGNKPVLVPTPYTRSGYLTTLTEMSQEEYNLRLRTDHLYKGKLRSKTTESSGWNLETHQIPEEGHSPSEARQLDAKGHNPSKKAASARGRGHKAAVARARGRGLQDADVVIRLVDEEDNRLAGPIEVHLKIDLRQNCFKPIVDILNKINKQ